MCGIAGEFRFDNRTPDAAAMDRMPAELARHDLSPRSKQRMLDVSSGTARVFNGTLYNYPGLRAELIGRGLFPIPTVTPKSFCVRMWNVERLHGMFAFAIWSRETLFLARDRLDIKPLLQ
jgi:asparagine synthase (glutamine-hydrolysing)